jgi:hypothetical protein
MIIRSVYRYYQHGRDIFSPIYRTIAVYPGTCSHCHRIIKKGTAIVYIKYLHEVLCLVCGMPILKACELQEKEEIINT